MTLAQAIDDLIKFVLDRDEPRFYQGAFCRGIFQPERDQFDELDQRVYILAFAAGLKDELPKPVDIEGLMSSPDLPPIGFMGRTCLPGNWIEGVFSFHWGWWQRDLLLLRSLADGEKLVRPRAPRAKGPTVDERMGKLLQDNLDRVSWSAEKWATDLSADLKRSVTATAVKLTETWKLIMRQREILKNEQAEHEEKRLNPERETAKELGKRLRAERGK